MKLPSNDLLVLIQDIKSLIKKARYNAVNAVNTEMLKAYYEIGKRIVEEEQGGSERAGYGEKLIDSISAELIKEFGRGFSSTSLKNMRIFYLTYKDRIGQSVTDEFGWKLSWTHYCELIKIDDEIKRRYFEKYAEKENLSVRDLKRQIYSLHYERLLMSKDKNALVEYERKGNVPDRSEEVIKDPYVLEFLDLEEKHTYTEKELETRILDDLQKFLPDISPEIKAIEINGKSIIEIKVSEGANKPYFLNGVAYKKVGVEKRIMPPDELKMLFMEQRQNKWDSEICKGVSIRDIDYEYIKGTFIPLYERILKRQIAGEVKDILSSIGCLINNKPTNAGILLFGKNPQKYFMNSYIALARYKEKEVGTERLDYKEFKGNLFQQI